MNTSHALRERGTALLELVIVTAVGGALGAVIVGSLFQLNRTARDGEAKTDIITAVQSSNRWLTRDIRRAESTDLSDPATAVASAQFDWDVEGTPVSCSYQVSGTDFTRTCGGVTVLVARGASNLTFDRSGTLVTTNLTITSPSYPDKSEIVEFNVAMRGG